MTIPALRRHALIALVTLLAILGSSLTVIATAPAAEAKPIRCKGEPAPGDTPSDDFPIGSAPAPGIDDYLEPVPEDFENGTLAPDFPVADIEFLLEDQSDGGAFIEGEEGNPEQHIDVNCSGAGFRSFTLNNFRYNVRINTGKTPAQVKSYDAHHVFPKKFESRFNRAGLNIHNPKYGSWWKASSHRSNAKKYNAEWESFFKSNPRPTKTQVLTKGHVIVLKYGLVRWW